MRDANNFRETNLKMWTKLLKEIFPLGIPSSAIWTDLRSMGSVLSKVGSEASSNHMFYPTQGGMDLLEAVPFQEEPGCLALRTGGRDFEVVKPSALMFESFGPDLEWAYFRIECLPMSPSGIYEDLGVSASEELALIAPGTYADRSAWDENEYEGKPLPKSAQLVERFLCGEAFVIFAKGSTYNLADTPFDAYDARHAKMSASEFKEYIKKLAHIS